MSVETALRLFSEDSLPCAFITVRSDEIPIEDPTTLSNVIFDTIAA
jgi:hypothetical protein